MKRGDRNDATGRKLLMAMTSAAVLYDRITDSGVFVKRSHVGVSPNDFAWNRCGSLNPSVGCRSQAWRLLMLERTVALIGVSWCNIE